MSNNRPMWVKADEWILVEKVEVLDCEEDEYGYDRVTFEYEGEKYVSPVVSGSRPG